MIVAIAGRRIDPPNAAQPRFPATAVDRVRQRLHDALVELAARAVVVSAACGTDLLALDAAAALGLRRRIVLPFDVQQFRSTSVVDRPGECGEAFDRQIADAETQNDLVVLEDGKDHDLLYARANERILDEAARLASADPPEHVTALIVWEGARRGSQDLTAHFADLARARGFPVHELSCNDSL